MMEFLGVKMNEFQMYVIGTIIVVLIFASILKKVFSELDKNGDFVKNETVSTTSNFTQEEILSLIDKEKEKCEKLCNELENLFDEYINQISDENHKNKASALKSVLLSIKNYPSDELKDKLLNLLPEFEECIKNALGEEKSSEFFNKAGQKYNDIFKG